MASIQKRPNGKYRARYRDAAGKEHARHFEKKKDAQRWLDEVTASVMTGRYIDPASARLTVQEYAERWLSLQVIRPNTRKNRATSLRRYILPALGDRPMSTVTRSEVQAWVNMLSRERGLAPGTVALHYTTLRAIFADAVIDNVVASTPCVKIKLPEEEHDDEPNVVPATTDQVVALAAAMPPRYSAAVILLAGSGLRVSELLGLRVSDVDFLRRTVKVERQRVRGGVGALKTKASKRTVPVGKVVTETLAAHLAAHPSEEWLFCDELGQPLTYRRWLRMWGPAKEKAGVEGIDTHSLRHFYASALIKGGASPKVVQARLGHASTSVTFNTYGHLWPDDDDLTRAVIDAAFAPLADSLRTEGASGP